MDIQYTKTEVIVGELGKPTITIRPSTIEPRSNVVAYSAVITFPISNGEILKLNYTKEEWNNFWNNFNSGKFLIEELKKRYDLKDLIIPADIETWFVNP